VGWRYQERVGGRERDKGGAGGKEEKWKRKEDSNFTGQEGMRK